MKTPVAALLILIGFSVIVQCWVMIEFPGHAVALSVIASAIFIALTSILLWIHRARFFSGASVSAQDLMVGEEIQSCIHGNYCLPTCELGHGWLGTFMRWSTLARLLSELGKVAGLPSMDDFTPVSGILYLT